MKKQLLTLIAILITSVSFAQKTDSIPFAGATKIIITNANKAEDNYKLAAKILLDQNYIIDKSDKEFFQLYTASAPVYGEGVTRLLSIYVLSRDSSITVIGRAKKKEGMQIVNIQQDTDNYEILPYKKSKLMKEIFSKTSAYAKLFGSTFLYSE